MNLFSFLNACGGVLTAFTFIPYIWAVARKKAKPSRSTWLIWTALDWLLLASMWAQGAINAQIVVCVVGATIVTALSFRFGVPGWSVTDTVCVLGAMAGLIGWVSLNDPNLAIITGGLAIWVGAIPTIKSIYADPQRESRLAWSISWFSGLFTLAGINPQAWDFAHAAQPIVFFLTSTVICVLLFWLPYIRKNMASRQPPF